MCLRRGEIAVVEFANELDRGLYSTRRTATFLRDGHGNDERDNDRKESDAGCYRPESETAMCASLGEKVTDGRTERASQDVRNPERQDPIRTKKGGKDDRGDRKAEDNDAKPESESECFRREVSGGGA